MPHLAYTTRDQEWPESKKCSSALARASCAWQRLACHRTLEDELEESPPLTKIRRVLPALGSCLLMGALHGCRSPDSVWGRPDCGLFASPCLVDAVNIRKKTSSATRSCFGRGVARVAPSPSSGSLLAVEPSPVAPKLSHQASAYSVRLARLVSRKCLTQPPLPQALNVLEGARSVLRQLTPEDNSIGAISKEMLEVLALQGILSLRFVISRQVRLASPGDPLRNAHATSASLAASCGCSIGGSR